MFFLTFCVTLVLFSEHWHSTVSDFFFFPKGRISLWFQKCENSTSDRLKVNHPAACKTLALCYLHTEEFVKNGLFCSVAEMQLWHSFLVSRIGAALALKGLMKQGKVVSDYISPSLSFFFFFYASTWVMYTIFVFCTLWWGEGWGGGKRLYVLYICIRFFTTFHSQGEELNQFHWWSRYDVFTRTELWSIHAIKMCVHRRHA